MGVPRGAFGGHFGDLGVCLGGFGVQSAPKSPSPDQGPSLFGDYSGQMEAKRLPKRSYNLLKFGSKIDCFFCWVLDGFWMGC